MIIDSHQHFWQLSRNDYTWLTPELTPLYKDYLPPDLIPTLNRLHIDGTIVVQAAPTFSDTVFMLELADKFSFIVGVVGWVDLTHPKIPDFLEQLASFHKLVGIRPMLENIEPADWMLQPALAASLEALTAFNLRFDALVREVHLPYLQRFIEKYPDLQIVIDHGAKPNIKQNSFTGWAAAIKHIAEFPHVYCKLSGLLTEASPGAHRDTLAPYIDHLYDCFGANRLMWGSDYPVLHLANDYDTWFNLCRTHLSSLGEEVNRAIFGENAIRFYGLNIEK